MIVGYARVSTLEQNLELQLDALKRPGCERICEDRLSGADVERPGWAQAQEVLRAGDTLVVWRLDRLGRSLKHLIYTVNELAAKGVGFRSLTENIDTTTAGGRLVFHIFGALAEFERELIRERTRAGLAARARGRMSGRPRKLTPRQVASAKRLIEEGGQPVSEVASYLGVARSTLCRALKERPSRARSIRRRKERWAGGRRVTYLYVHRLVVAQHLGRPLTSRETVHHINGDPTDNRPDNLIAFTSQATHMRVHHYLDREPRGIGHLFPLDEVIRVTGRGHFGNPRWTYGRLWKRLCPSTTWTSANK